MIIAPAQRLQQVNEYYFSAKLAEIRQLNEQGKDIINIGIGSPDLPPHKGAVSHLLTTALNPDNHSYQSYTGIPELRNAITQWYAHQYGVVLSPHNEVLPLMGSKEGIMHISMAFLNPGDGVLVPNPGYPTYAAVAHLLHANVLTYPLNETNNWEPDWDVLNSMDLTNVKLMWVNYPNMPTGANASADLFARLVSFAQKHKILLVNDNPYSLILNPNPQSILQTSHAMEVALELNSLSKSHNMAGWRIGMLTGRQDYLRCVLQVKSNMDSGMFLGIQKAAAYALQHCTEAWQNHLNQVYQHRQQLALNIAHALQCQTPHSTVGMFLWVKAPQNIDNVPEWADYILHRHRVFITPGFIFGSAGNRYLRISLCCKEHRLQEALHRIIN